MTGEKSWADLVAAEREKRLSTIDSDSEKIEERVKAEEAARAQAAQDGLEDKGAPAPAPSADSEPDHRH